MTPLTKRPVAPGIRRMDGPPLARLCLSFSLWLAMGVAEGAGMPAPESGQWLRDVSFTDYSPLSRSAEMARRLLTPLSFERLQQTLATEGRAMREQPIDLAREKFVVYVPAGAPPQKGYGMLVFVPPWPEARLPDGWSQALDRHGLIFVSAANSGNGADVLDRRIPLALLAYENIHRRYPIDPARVYVGGMSGGSRVGLRIALAYPDVFDGALLNAGSDPIGVPPSVLPPAPLFERFQDSTRLVYLTGERDEPNLSKDQASRHSMQGWCVFDLDTEAMPWRGHEIADYPAVERALDALEKPRVVNRDRLEACRMHVVRQLSKELADAEAAVARSDRRDARALIDAVDAHYGGLAAPAIVTLQARLDALK